MHYEMCSYMILDEMRMINATITVHVLEMSKERRSY